MENKLKTLFDAKVDESGKAFSLTEFVTSLESRDSDQLFSGASSLVANIGQEDFGDMNNEMRDAAARMYQSLDEQLQSHGFEQFNATRGGDASRVAGNQKLAATMAGIAFGDESAYRKHQKSMTVSQESSDPNVISVSPSIDGPGGSTTAMPSGVSLENYNEKSQRDFRVISVGYNLGAARQDPFGEALYPTVVVNPTEGGVTQNLTYAAVLQDVFHQTTGALFDTREVNMVEAFRDPSILEDKSTSLVPVVDSEGNNARAFVDSAKIGRTDLDVDYGGPLKTAPLKIGERFDLMGVSNRHQLIAGNLLDTSDTIDPAIRLKNIYVELANGKVVRFQVSRMPTAVFQPALVGDTRKAQLNFTTEDLTMDGDTKTIDGTAQAGLTELESSGHSMRLAVNVTGSVSTSKGDTWISSTEVVVDKVFDDQGVAVNKTTGTASSIITALGDMKVIGYDLDARFTNTNRRERGQLVQTRTLQFRYPIPMHSPITLPMSTMDSEGEGGVVKTLTVATNIRNSMNAVTRLLNYLAQLSEVVGAGYDRPKFGAVEGAMSAMMRPTYRYAMLDLRTAIDTVRSKDRWEDVGQTILNQIKSLLFPAHRDSNIEAAFQTVTGNSDERPKYIIATDKEIANYLMTKGDDRTLGAYFKYDIVATNNEKFDGKIVVIPTRENPVEGDILNWGQFYYVPTIIADLPISRNGEISREIAAVPFNLHVNNIPFAIEIDVTGLSEVMGESQFNRLPGFQTETVQIEQTAP